jgi:hypothetical protein
MNCICCGVELTGGIDTFGDVNLEMCRSCWFETQTNVETWYGLAPHKHTYDEQGNIIIGGTVFTGEPIPEGCTFTPDPDAPGCGIWTGHVNKY